MARTPSPEAPALGSFIGMDLISVNGAAGGFFGFWENGATEPTVSVSDQGSETDRWLLSENEGAPGSDPFGHIHGRRFTATLPGLYRVGFRLVDLSTNGMEAGPIHTPSEVLYMHFQAGITITSVVHQADSAAVMFGAPVDGSYALEYSTNLTSSIGWTPIDNTVPGDDHFQTLMDPDPDGSTRFYRVRLIDP